MPISSRTRTALIVLLPVLFIALVFAGTRDLGFVWDDLSLSMLPVYKSCDLQAIFTTLANGFEYLPVRDLTLCVDHALWGDSAAGFHIQNLFWFILSSFLVGSLYRTLFAASADSVISQRAPMLGLACTLVFALHPLQVEPVAFITARNALLALFFVLAALTCYARFIRTRSIPCYALSILFTFIAMFSKATALPAALLILFLHVYLERDAKPSTAILRTSPHFGAALLAAVLHLVLASTHGAMSATPSLSDMLSRLPRAGFIPAFYSYKFAWPASQSVEYVMAGVRENLLILGVTGAVFYAVAGWIIIRGFRSRNLTSYLCLAFFCALLPVLNLFPTYPPVADRYVQIPLVFLTPLFVVPVLISLPEKWGIVLAISVVTILGTTSYRQIPVWTSDETLFSHAVAVDHRAMVSLENLAYTRWWTGAEDKALEAFEMIAQQRPDDSQYPLFRAWRAVHLGDYDSAEQQLDLARARSATPYVVYMISGEMNANRGRSKRARRDYERARDDARKRVRRDSRARFSLILIDRALRDLLWSAEKTR